MAELKKIIPRPALSDFRQMVQPGPNIFSALSEMADIAYQTLAPAAVEEMKRKGTAAGQSWAQGGTVTPSTKGQVALDPNTPQGLGADTMAVLGKTDADRLHGVDPRIDEVVRQAAGNLGITIGVSEGLRSEERQKKMVAEGKSQTMNSKHLHGGAADYFIVGPDGKPNWDFEAYRPLAEEAKRIAAEKGYEGFGWGGDWKTLKDGVHFQFEKAQTDLIAAANPNSPSGPAKYRDAIASIESAGSGDYQAVGPTDEKLGRALGRYGIMEANVGPWSKEVLGREVTADEFMADPSIQDAIFDAKFGQYVEKFGEEGAAQAWLGGPGNVGNTDQADSLGTSVGDYGQKFMAALGDPVTASTKGQPVMVRTKEGKVEPRLFSPLSGPILQAYNAAAGVAYVSEKMVQGQSDLIAMSSEFALDPQGFQNAAEGYIKQMMDDAPEMFRADLQGELRQQAQRTFLGIVEDQQRDTRQRAANSSQALVERWSGEYSSAIASGDMQAAGAAEGKLRDLLRARESLPGLAWTPEQSENVILKARETAARDMETAKNEAVKAYKAELDTVISAAKAGMTAANESILNDPSVQALLPDQVAEAKAFTMLRDEIPTFNTMTPAAQAAALAEMKSQPIYEKWEADLYAAAEKVAADNAKAWKDDPIKRAGEVLQDEPPPAIPELDPNNPQTFMAAMGERAAYANKLMDAGYTDRPVYVSKDEAKTLGAMFAKEVPPELKAMAAGAIVGAMGDDAAGFFKQIKTNDPVIPHVGALMARGGDTTVAVEAMQGQSLIDQKVVPAPSAAAVAKGRATVETALAGVPGVIGAMGGVQKTAEAIYAARIPANADEETQASVMQGAWQAALGQHDDLGITRGGVQKVGGQDVLLPPTLAGEDLESAMMAAFGVTYHNGFGSSIIPKDWKITDAASTIDATMWMSAAGGIPALGGEPISPQLWQNGEIIMTPVGGSKYMLSVKRGGATIDVGVQGQPDDVPFIFDAEALIDASMVP